MTVQASTRLRALLNDPSQIVVGPGVYDGITARLALNAGFQTLYMTGAGTSMSTLGMADLGLATMTEMRQNAEMIANIDRSVPLIADADTGYGGTLSVARTTAAYISAGVAGFHLEDQVVNKKCGHLEGKQLVSKEEYLTRIRAAVETKKRMGSDIVIIARTDALQSLGLEESLTRLEAAVDAGADVAFLEAITKREELVAVCERFKGKAPVMYGMVQGSSAYKVTVDEAKALGVKIIVYAGACLMPTFVAVSQALKTLKETGDCEQYGGGQWSPHKVFDACGMKELMDFDRMIASNAANPK
ncbi:hypothetical protein H2204_013507 [Knufia peltigerae]|uniref:Uncharacterized protein n=1 Tax=Knufia peltigerae TaxID=1002370 RepID=A0AA38XQC9_9EURO|nr:hypothetical protein H2204_013507 [Knufia peltigerae]